MDDLKNYIRLLRLSHWSKALFVLLGYIYTPLPGYLAPALLAALAFCLISSAVYIYNDLQDRSEDSLHPYKKQRPIPSGAVPIFNALIMLFFLLLSGLTLGWIVSKELAIILSSYIAVNLAYNHILKLIPIIDVLCIAAGFMLRVLAGTVGIGLPISVWLTVAATLLSLFIALNKRRLEIKLGLKHSTRKVLKKYNLFYLNWLITLTGIVSFITYLLYTFYVHAGAFYFILTLPFAAFALWRFSWLTNQKVGNDDPVDLFLKDHISRFNLFCFAGLTFMALVR